jgi:hypothetical protein
MPTNEQLSEWINQYKKIFKTTLTDGTILIWRRLRRSEYREFMRKFGSIDEREERIWEREEATCKACILYPSKEEVESILENQAGVATLISDDIFANSGFTVKEETEEVTL